MGEIWRKERAACHGRPKTIRLGYEVCDVCGQDRQCLGFDSSDEEYGDVWVCEECTIRTFAHASVLSPSEDK